MIERFVGRDRELARLDAAAADLARGQGRLVVVSGEAGVGKTRFCAETAERRRQAGARVVVARCWSDGGAPSLWPWHSILAELGDDEAVDLLASPPGHGDGVNRADRERDRFARFAGVADRLADACARTPVCLVIDDVQDADLDALSLVRFVARCLPRFPLLLVLGRRTGEPAEGREEECLLDELAREATTIELSGLDLAEVEAFLTHHGAGPVAPDVLTTLSRLTRGHPRHLRRVVEAAGASGAEPDLRRGLRVAADQALAGLDAASRRVLSVAAVLGVTPLVSEAAEVAGCDTVAVLGAVDEGEAAGVVAMDPDDGRLAFGHELVRAALENRLPAAERLEAHARAAAVVAADHLAGPRAERLARAAQHARQAASRSTEDARRAVSLCEAAAQAMARRHAYGQADSLFSAAVDLHASARLGKPCSLLVLQWAQAATLRGHMSTARERYRVAVARAEAEDRPGLLGEAALGWGGVWLGGYATPVERTRMLDLYRTTLERMPAVDPAYETLRVRLRVRLAAEEAFARGPLPPVWEAVDAARRTGDRRTWAEALALAHHAAFTPAHTRTRLALADELVGVTSSTDLSVLSLVGLLWRTVDILHLGTEPCTRALEILRERARELSNEHVLYHVGVIDVLLLAGQGRLATAEAEAGRLYALGERTGQVDRFVYLAAQTASIRWMQGRDAEMLAAVDDVASSPTLADSEFSVWALAACLAARGGDHERARVVLKRCLPADLADLAPSGTWMAGLAALVEAAAALGDADLAAQAYDLLEPYADLPVVAGLGIVCLGSAERTLGAAAATLGRYDLAVEHLERAVAANERLGNRPMATIARGELAQALVRRDPAAHDRDRAAALLRQAVAEAWAMEMPGRAAEWTTWLEAWERPRREERRPVAAATTAGLICREGRRWVVAVGDRRVRVPHRVGMRYLAELVTNPGRRIPALTLADHLADSGSPPRQELLDERARTAYTTRAREIAAELAEAEGANDLHRAERLRVELDALVDQLEAATGLYGRPRHFPHDHERARVAVQKAIKRAIDAIDDADPKLADELRETITTGVTCSYTPRSEAPITWSTRQPERQAVPVRHDVG